MADGSRPEASGEASPQIRAEGRAETGAALEPWFRTSPSMLHCIDSRGRVAEVSDAWLDGLGYQRAGVLGKSLSDFLTPEFRAVAVETAGRSDSLECQIVRGDGRVLDVIMTTISQSRDADRGALNWVAVIDVTALKAASRALAESEARYRGLVEDQSDLVALSTPEGELLFVNDAYGRQYGRDPREIIGTNLFDYIPDAHRERVAEQLRGVCEEGKVVENENQVVLPSGETRWMAWTNRAIFAACGRVTAIHSVGRDIERRVVAERGLKESEARYRLLADNASDMVMLVRQDGRRVYVSPACRELLGWEPEDMLSIKTQDAVHPDDLEKIMGWLANAEDYNTTLTYRLRRRNGGYVWVEAAARRVSTDGEASLRLVVVRDIEARIAAARRIEESEAAYRLLAENSSDMVFQLDLDLVRRYVSPASREILGYDPSELVGRKPIERCHPDDAERLARVFHSLLRGESDRQSIVNRRQHRDGRWIWVESRLRALRDPATGELRGITGALRDISTRKSVEDQLAQANQRLEILAARDGLTGLANRRTFDEALAREYLRALREQSMLALMMIDVDRFKSFNDHFGHPAGDECLRRVAGAVESAIRRPGDLAARYGGEEFAVLLPNTDERGAAEVAEAIRAAVRALALPEGVADARAVTVSAGVAAITSGHRRDGHKVMLADADRALYAAKNGGRDQVARASRLGHGARMADPPRPAA
jgi:diguanylate cyclase (GGDEF)-like protein/PAS domain S-box-containing protein